MKRFLVDLDEDWREEILNYFESRIGTRSLQMLEPRSTTMSVTEAEGAQGSAEEACLRIQVIQKLPIESIVCL